MPKPHVDMINMDQAGMKINVSNSKFGIAVTISVKAAGVVCTVKFDPALPHIFVAAFVMMHGFQLTATGHGSAPVWQQ